MQQNDGLADDPQAAPCAKQLSGAVKAAREQAARLEGRTVHQIRCPLSSGRRPAPRVCTAPAVLACCWLPPFWLCVSRT